MNSAAPKISDLPQIPRLAQRVRAGSARSVPVARLGAFSPWRDRTPHDRSHGSANYSNW